MNRRIQSGIKCQKLGSWDDEMNLMLNGEPAEAPDAVTVAAFLEQLGLPLKGVAVERNREIVPKSMYRATRLAEGDRIEIVQFVGGG
jgi:thiamine biosynthesis protein ThiS